MNNQKAIEMLTAKAECIRREASGTDIDCKLRNCDECDLCYKQGTMGDQMEALCVAISALQAQDLQPTCNKLATNTIDRQAAIDALEKVAELFPWKVPGNRDSYDRYNEAWNDAIGRAEIEIEKLPSAQPDGIPLEWIDKHLEWLDNCDNDFAQIAKVSIRAMVNLWKKDRT